MSNQLNELSAKNKELARRTKQKHQLEGKLWENVLGRVGVISTVQILAESYKDEDETGCIGDVLSAIAWDNYPDESFDNLIKRLAAINPQFGKEVKDAGIDFSVYSERERFPASGWKNPYLINVDLDEWWKSLPDNAFLKKAIEKEDPQVSDAINIFAQEISDEVIKRMENENLEQEDLKKFLLPGDFLHPPFSTKEYEIEEIDGIFHCDLGVIGLPSDNEDFWGFIDANRGQLIWYQSFKNPDLLPDDLIFVIQ